MIPFGAVLTKLARVTLRRNVFFTFSGPLRLKDILLRQFLTDRPPEIVSKSMKPRGTSLKKSKKRRAIALVTLGDLWRSGSALGGSGGALGGPGGASGGSGGALEELWESLYID